MCDKPVNARSAELMLVGKFDRPGKNSEIADEIFRVRRSGHHRIAPIPVDKVILPGIAHPPGKQRRHEGEEFVLMLCPFRGKDLVFHQIVPAPELPLDEHHPFPVLHEQLHQRLAGHHLIRIFPRAFADVILRIGRQILRLQKHLRIKVDPLQIVPLRQLIKLLHGVGRDHVVGIQEINVLSLRHFQAAVPAIALHVVLGQMEYADPLVPGGVFVQDLPAAVRRGVVDADALQLPHGLAQHAVQTVRQILFHVIDRDDHRHFFHSFRHSKSSALLTILFIFSSPTAKSVKIASSWSVGSITGSPVSLR